MVALDWSLIHFERLVNFCRRAALAARFVGTESAEVTLLTEGEIQLQLFFCHCSSQSIGNLTETGTLDPTVLGSNLVPSMLSGTNLTWV